MDELPHASVRPNRPPPGGAESSKQQAALFPILAWFRPYLGELRYVNRFCRVGAGLFADVGRALRLVRELVTQALPIPKPRSA
jgi:hypothetical protein